MKATPMFLGACALASIAGALSGATTNTAPIQNGGIGMDMLPTRAFAFDSGDTGQRDAALPDHYPIVTPTGRVEVGELSTRGLYAQQRFGWRQAEYAPPSDHAFDADRVEFADTASAATAAPPVIMAQPAASPIQPLDLPTPPRGEARLIDVNLEVAAAS